MANRISSNKKDREKLKQQKRLEKQKRKDIRHSKGTSSFEDMIAYVDEYGGLHSTPQEIIKDDINVDDVVISTPKQEEEKEEKLPQKGRVEYFNSQKGYGFIKSKESTDKYFFHISNAPEDIDTGDEVTFELESGLRGMNAVRISITKS